MLRALIFLTLSVFALTSGAQSNNLSRKKSSAQRADTDAPTSLQPYFPERDFAPEAEKKSRKKGVKETPITYNARERFYERMEEVARQRRKNEKLMEKPQYSDPMYFGHKRPPKKRPPEKMKYCKVCGIRH